MYPSGVTKCCSERVQIQKEYEQKCKKLNDLKTCNCVPYSCRIPKRRFTYFTYKQTNLLKLQKEIFQWVTCLKSRVGKLGDTEARILSPFIPHPAHHRLDYSTTKKNTDPICFNCQKGNFNWCLLLEERGIEPRTFSMQMKRHTTRPHPQLCW
jgi:hypothetical protein